MDPTTTPMNAETAPITNIIIRERRAPFITSIK